MTLGRQRSHFKHARCTRSICCQLRRIQSLCQFKPCVPSLYWRLPVKRVRSLQNPLPCFSIGVYSPSRVSRRQPSNLSQAWPACEQIWLHTLIRTFVCQVGLPHLFLTFPCMVLPIATISSWVACSAAFHIVRVIASVAHFEVPVRRVLIVFTSRMD
jgi:hypothetical protein